MSLSLTAMERACVEAVVVTHWPDLRLDGLQVMSRESTGVGLYVNFEDAHQQPLPDGVYEVGGMIVEMEAILFGLDFALSVSGGRLSHLELVTPGPDGWDGVERSWRLVGR